MAKSKYLAKTLIFLVFFIAVIYTSSAQKVINLGDTMVDSDKVINLVPIKIIINTFTELLDTPDDYTNQAGLCLAVDSGEGRLIFQNCTNATIFSADNSSWNQSFANTLYLNLSGTNANQNIDVSPFNLTAGSYFGSGENLELAKIGSSSLKTIQDLQNLFHSSGTFNSNSTFSFSLRVL